MRLEFNPETDFEGVLRLHGTDYDRFTPTASHVLKESFKMAHHVGHENVSTGHLLLRLSLTDELDEENTRAIMAKNNLTAQSIASVMEFGDELDSNQPLQGLSPDYTSLLEKIDYYRHLFPGLMSGEFAIANSLDLLYMATRWTGGATAYVFQELDVSPEHVLADCRAQRWYSNLYHRPVKDPTSPLKRRGGITQLNRSRR